MCKIRIHNMEKGRKFGLTEHNLKENTLMVKRMGEEF
jgi:hypothetical protein